MIELILKDCLLRIESREPDFSEKEAIVKISGR